MFFNSFSLLAFILLLGFLFLLRQKKKALGIRILWGLALGIGYGLCLRFALPKAQFFFWIPEILRFIGDGYLKLLKMLVVPLILTSIVYAILNLGTDNHAVIKKLGFLACAMLLGMTALASLIGIGVGMFFSVGKGVVLPAIFTEPSKLPTGIVDTLLGMLPSNPIMAMSGNNTVAVLLFAVLLGISARLLDAADHDKMRLFEQFIASSFAIIKKLATIVLGLTPYAVLALISELILTQGIAVLDAILNFVLAMYVAMLLVFVMHMLILLKAGYTPKQYFKRAIAPLFVAFTTRSSLGTLPVSEETLRDKFKTAQVTATFVPSIGATIGMNACAGIFPAMLVVMALTILHQPVTWEITISVMLMNMIASLGISGIPGTAFIAATVTLTSLNLPYAVVALVQGVDPIVDMGRTATNVNGVLTTALVVDKAL